MARNNEIIEAKGLVKTYNGKRVVDKIDICLGLHSGESEAFEGQDALLLSQGTSRIAGWAI